ncbi:MAG TPA: hypothetical protein PLI10_01525 [Bacillota bacterium]|nr:hypothetical protein [Bacillota bacterium]HOH10952.1 hypothetical protein [Bacillota bacterium]HOS50085.1 hypothetical protein [Bacillota bacterium]HPI01872.1 hypothetical protein [Bacillota bacterium]HPM63791.1 hypothetical protein [Bacillota bacterium]
MSPASKNLREKLGLAHLNPLALLRLSPKTKFEHVVEKGYSTDVLGWFGEAWIVFKSRRNAIILASLPSMIAAFFMIYLFYRQQGRATSTSVVLFGSYLRTVLIMSTTTLPSFVALGALVKSEDTKRDYTDALWRLPGILLISAAMWVPIVYSGFMGELGVIVRWWAVPVAIYLAVAYSFAPYLAVDGRMDFWTALETSRRAVSRNWFGIAGMYAIYYLAAWVFSAALSMLPGIFSTILVVDEMTKKLRNDPIDIMYGFSNAFMAGLFYVFLIFFQIVLATAYVRIFRPIGYKKAA